MKRANILKGALLSVLAVIVVRLFFIQIVKHGDYVSQAEAEHVSQDTVLAERGEIYMMDGEKPTAVVMNETIWTVLVDPMLADEKKTQDVVNKYAKDNVIADWKDVFKDRTRRYYVVAKNIERKAAEGIKKEELPGVWMQEGTKRVYPEGESASALLGFVNADGDGQYGVEGALNEELKGKNGLLKTVRDVNNIPLTIGDDNVRIPAQDGKNYVLTIDRNIQRSTEKILAESIKDTEITNAAAVVMDPNTGKVLAMANVPTYNPAKYNEVRDASLFSNTVLEDAYEPASVCKTFTFAAAINEGKMTPDTTYSNKGYTTVDGWKIANAYQGMYSTINMQTALNYSLNTGSTQALRLLGDNPNEINEKGRTKLYEYYHDKFGLGQETGIELYESAGLLLGPNEGTGLNSRFANMTFGQNLNLTMMQVSSAFSSVVNGGKFYTPTVIAGEMKNGKFIQNEQKDAARQTITPATSETMRSMLYGARNSRRLYGIDKPGFYVGGKTGTAQVIKDGAYTLDETVASYVGFGGAEGEMPQYVAMIKVWADGKKIEGERHAMPIFDKLSNYMIDYLKIRPTK